jgi:HSP20 family protein
MTLSVRPEAFSTEFNRLFSSLFEPGAASQQWVPAMDLVETEDSYLLKADLPGIKHEAVSIEFNDGTLTISGERKAEYERKEKGFFRLERSFGKFSRSLSLPDGIDVDKIEAGFHDGVLEVKIPKPEQRKPRQIAVSRANRAADSEHATIEGTSS